MECLYTDRIVRSAVDSFKECFYTDRNIVAGVSTLLQRSMPDGGIVVADRVAEESVPHPSLCCCYRLDF
jgi:hypothetical protein